MVRDFLQPCPVFPVAFLLKLSTRHGTFFYPCDTKPPETPPHPTGLRLMYILISIISLLRFNFDMHVTTRSWSFLSWGSVLALGLFDYILSSLYRTRGNGAGFYSLTSCRPFPFLSRMPSSKFSCPFVLYMSCKGQFSLNLHICAEF